MGLSFQPVINVSTDIGYYMGHNMSKIALRGGQYPMNVVLHQFKKW